nr:hypothetical protein [Tanacetum cinerariifolium]GFA51817.1 hypothetical protein [Tanacetum cinerariifolium]
SIYRLNLRLVFKWVWRFLCNSPNLWVRVVKIIHGPNGGIMEDSNYSSCYSPWSGILSSTSLLKSKGIDLLSLCVKKIGNGASIRFWDDIWCGNQPFKLQFPRIYQLESVKDCFIADRIGISDWIAVFRRPSRGSAEMSQFNDLLSLTQDVVLSDSSDSWMWSVDASSGYTVASGRTLIDSNILDVGPKATRWNRLIPNKVNVFIWRLMLNKLHTRVNLDRRDIDVGSILCPICLEDIETVNHIFFSCNMAKDLWSMFAKWWDIDIPVRANVSEWFESLDDLAVSNKVRSYIDGVGDSLMWHIWKFINESIFSSSLPKKALIWDSIVSHSFLWISSRNPKCTWSTLISNDMDSNESDDDHDMEEHRSTNEDVDPNAALDDFIQQNIVKKEEYFVTKEDKPSEEDESDTSKPAGFIIVMEGLHMALNDGIASNMFHGVRIGSNIHLSHLFCDNRQFYEL